MTRSAKKYPGLMSNSDKKKVLFIQPAFGHYRYALFELLHKNHDVTFIFIRNMSEYPSSISPNPEWNMFFLNRERNHFWLLKLAHLIFQLKPDVIITSINGSYQSIASLIMGRILKIPVILWSLTWDTSRFRSSHPSWKNFQRETRIRWTTKNADAIVAGGTQARKFNQQIAPEGKPIFTAYQSTLDQFLMMKEHAYSNSRSSGSKPTILYLSRIVMSKGLDILIRAFSEIEKNMAAHLIVAGEGPFLRHCEMLAKQLALRNISFYGEIQNEDCWKLYNKADIFVLPCSGKNGTEAWGLVINEATSMGLPIVTTDAVGAVGDLVQDGVNGYVVKAGSTSALRVAIEKLLSDDSLRDRMGKESRKLFDSINSYEKMYDGFHNAILSITQGH